MSCGAPVVASGVSSMPELLGDAEGTFDPTDPDDIGRALREALGTPDRLEALRERSRRQVAFYTWERVASRTIEGYERAAEVEMTHRRPGRGIRPGAGSASGSPWSRPGRPSARRRPGTAGVWSRRSANVDVDVIVSAEEPLDFDAALEGVRLNRRRLRVGSRAGGVRPPPLRPGGSSLHLHALENMMKTPALSSLTT